MVNRLVQEQVKEIETYYNISERILANYTRQLGVLKNQVQSDGTQQGSKSGMRNGNDGRAIDKVKLFYKINVKSFRKINIICFSFGPEPPTGLL